MELQSLNDIVEDYRRCSYATGTPSWQYSSLYEPYSPGAIFLPLRCSQEFDATNEGREYRLMRCPPGDADPRKLLYERRWACYQICVDSLSMFDDPPGRCYKEGRTGTRTRCGSNTRLPAGFWVSGSSFPLFLLRLVNQPWYDRRTVRGEYLPTVSSVTNSLCNLIVPADIFGKSPPKRAENSG